MWQQGPIGDDSCHAGSRPRASKERAGMSTRATKRGRSGARKRTRGGGRAPAKRRAPARRAGVGLWLRVPGLGQRELDLIGLGLVAVGLFLGSVMYLGWAGGQVGGALTDAVRFLVGVVAYGVPVGLVGGRAGWAGPSARPANCAPASPAPGLWGRRRGRCPSRRSCPPT